jgi:hypothetical protein
MSDKEPVWNSLVEKHNLLNYTFREAAAWPFGEAVFNLGYDVMSDTTKSRRFGFYEWAAKMSRGGDARRQGAIALQKEILVHTVLEPLAAFGYGDASA